MHAMVVCVLGNRATIKELVDFIWLDWGVHSLFNIKVFNNSYKVIFKALNDQGHALKVEWTLQKKGYSWCHGCQL